MLPPSLDNYIFKKIKAGLARQGDNYEKEIFKKI
jgi:hypothetical protein